MTSAVFIDLCTNRNLSREQSGYASQIILDFCAPKRAAQVFGLWRRFDSATAAGFLVSGFSTGFTSGEQSIFSPMMSSITERASRFGSRGRFGMLAREGMVLFYISFMEKGKYASDSKEFHLKEYECLRKEFEWLLQESRSLERNVVIAVGVTWGWLLDKSISRVDLPKWAWFALCLFAGLGVLRYSGITKRFDTLHRYLHDIEEVFSASGGLRGWEHFDGQKMDAN